MSSFKFRKNIKKISGGSSSKKSRFTVTKKVLTDEELKRLQEELKRLQEEQQKRENKNFGNKLKELQQKHAKEIAEEAKEEANKRAKEAAASESGGGGAATKPKEKSSTVKLRCPATRTTKSVSHRRVHTTRHNSNSEEPIIKNMEVFNHPDICRKVLEEYIIREKKEVGEARELQDELEATIQGKEHSSYRQMKEKLITFYKDKPEAEVEQWIKNIKRKNGNDFKVPERYTLQPRILITGLCFSPKRDDIQEEVIKVLNRIPIGNLVGKISIKRKGLKKKQKRKAQKKKKPTKGKTVKKRTKKNL